MWIGCHADSHEDSQWFGDDISVRRDSYLVDWSGLPYLRFLTSNVAKGRPLLNRINAMAALVANARGQISRMIHSHCASAGLPADRLGVDGAVRDVLAYIFERYGGGGLPRGLSGDAIPMAMRVAQLADMVEVHQRTYGVDGAVAMARSRRGGQFDPAVVDAFVADAAPILAGPPVGDAWAAALREAPGRDRRLSADELDALLIALGDFVDLKCPFTLGHSQAVARLAATAAGCGPRRLDDGAARRARARLRADRYLHSDLVQARPAHVSRVGAGAAAPVFDGAHPVAGYPRGLSGAALGVPDRIPAAAVHYQSAREARPYRAERSAPLAERRLRDAVAAGALDAAAVEAVLQAAGHATERRVARPDGLTPRELEVLGLVARGASNR